MEFKTIINVCLNVFISCHLFWTLFCHQLFQHKDKLPILNSWWLLNRGKIIGEPSLGQPKVV